MSEFWPEGLELTDTQSPLEILKSAQEEWDQKTNGVMSLVLQNAKSESGNEIIIVHAKHNYWKRTATLFNVIHRPQLPYPARIETKEDLPLFLRKTTRIQTNSLASEIANVRTVVTNEWVSDTPAEFRKLLSKAFNLGNIKSEIISLASEPNASNGTAQFSNESN